VKFTSRKNLNKARKENMINWMPVKSSNLAALSHHEGILHVRFKSGAVYAYDEVSDDLFRLLLGAQSVGKAFNEFIKPLPYTRVLEFQD
jgi:hypothetical protein